LAADSVYHFYIHCADSEAVAANSSIEDLDTTPPANVSGLRAVSADAPLYWRPDADYSELVIRRSTSLS
jgi:hypothetical protein